MSVGEFLIRWTLGFSPVKIVTTNLAMRRRGEERRGEERRGGTKCRTEVTAGVQSQQTTKLVSRERQGTDQ